MNWPAEEEVKETGNMDSQVSLSDTYNKSKCLEENVNVT